MNKCPVLLLLAGIALGLPARASDDLAELEEQAMKAAVRRVAPSVVRLETFGGQQRVGGLLVSQSPTTGVAVSADGYVISSAFNFVQQPASILATLPSGERASAEIVARDHSCMLVLLKVHTDEPLVPAVAAPPDAMRVGQWALAVGRSYEADEPSLSVGILSAKNRIWGKAIQTDAKISPRNYGGPLVDIAGRVLGVLVPLSPHGQSEVAGAEWYDSGIGFAVPLSEIYGRLDRLKEGDLYPGILGVTLQGNDLYSSAAEIAACQPRSPAYQAGLRAGDTIVECEGVAIERQAELKHVLGGRYAGDQVRLVALRGDERIEAVIELTDKLEPYEHPFLGALPLRDDPADQPGVVVRYVYPDSGAAAAGLAAGDRIVSLDGEPLADAGALRLALANREPGDKVRLSILRDAATQQIEIQLGSLPAEIPAALPPPRTPASGEAPPRDDVGVIDLKVPEEPNDCYAYVPEQYDPRIAHGVVVYLIAPGAAADRDQLVARWKAECDLRDLILVVPQPSDPRRWLPTEINFVRKTVDLVTDRYRVDPSRVVVCGHQAGGVLAYLTALRQRDLFRGVAAIDAALPLGFQPPSNDPVQRLAVYTTLAERSALADRIRADAELFGQLKYPVTLKPLGELPRDLNQDELAELVRWVDTLDRF